MARIACLFSVEFYHTVERPLLGWDKVPFGLSIIAACLERAGHQVRCWVVCPASPLRQVAREIVEEFGCEMVAASAVTTQFPLIARLCGKIREIRPEIPVLLGGVHAGLRPEEAIAHPAVDAICIGEGEDVAVAWAAAVAAGRQPSGIPGTWIRIPGQAEPERTPGRAFRTDLDELPLMNLDHWARWIDPADRALRVVVGRGCPYSCRYCSNHALRLLHEGRYLRFRSPENVLGEIDGIVKRFPDLKSIYLELETIGSSIPWALQLCKALAAFNATRTQPIEFGANLAVTSRLVRNEEELHRLLSAFRRARLTRLNVGLESGSERVRKEILNRPEYTNADLIRFCEVARGYGIGVTLYMMIGLPTETRAEAVQTSVVARACRPVEIAESIFYPYPGTKLHAMAVELGLIDPAHMALKAERARVYLRLKDFPRWQVFTEYVLMGWRVFHGRRSTIRLVRRTLSRAFRILPGLLITSLQWKEALQGRRSAEIPDAAD